MATAVTRTRDSQRAKVLAAINDLQKKHPKVGSFTKPATNRDAWIEAQEWGTTQFTFPCLHSPKHNNRKQCSQLRLYKSKLGSVHIECFNWSWALPTASIPATRLNKFEVIRYVAQAYIVKSSHAWHGPEFIEVYCQLLEETFGSEIAADFISICRAKNINMTVLTDPQKADLEAKKLEKDIERAKKNLLKGLDDLLKIEIEN